MRARLAWGTAALTLILIAVGGLVTNTDSGLACPDWPTCFGSPFPKLVGGVLMEHGHRYLATAVGVLVVLLVLATHAQAKAVLALVLGLSMPLILGGAIWAGAAKHSRGEVPALATALVLLGYLVGIAMMLRARGEQRHAQAALLLVITQGLLGGLTVMYQLPVTILVLHLATSMLFLGVLVALAQRLDIPASRDGFGQQRTNGTWLAIATAAIYLQILIGATVRHTGAGLICTGWLCKGQLWPMSGVHPALHLHMVHRAFALVAGGLATYAAIRVWRAASEQGALGLARVALAVPLLVLAQIGLGIATIWTLKELWAVTAHLFIAALLLALCTWLWSQVAAAQRQTAPSATRRTQAGAAGLVDSRETSHA